MPCARSSVRPSSHSEEFGLVGNRWPVITLGRSLRLSDGGRRKGRTGGCGRSLEWRRRRRHAKVAKRPSRPTNGASEREIGCCYVTFSLSCIELIPVNVLRPAVARRNGRRRHHMQVSRQPCSIWAAPPLTHSLTLCKAWPSRVDCLTCRAGDARRAPGGMFSRVPMQASNPCVKLRCLNSRPDF